MIVTMRTVNVTSRRQRNSRGFSLMELLIVIAIILTILAVALPKVNQARMSANELAVTKQIGTIHTAQAQYNSQFGKFAVAMSELGPPPSGAASASAADLMPSDLATGKKNGYTFQLQGTPGGYTINVNPDSFNGTGRRSFYSDQSLVIRNNWGPEPASPSSPEIK